MQTTRFGRMALARIFVAGWVAFFSLAIEHAHALGAVTGANSSRGAPAALVLWVLVLVFGGMLPRLLRKFASK